MFRSALPCVVVAAALATGCATMPESTASDRAASLDESRIDQDVAYMQRIEQIALRRGIHVTWVHPPTKRRTPDAD